MSVLLVVPDRVGLGPSGGDRYDAAVAAAWRRLGRSVDVVAVPDGWPWPDGTALRGLRRALEGEVPVVVDGLVGCAAPEEIEEAARRRRVVMLVHAPLSAGAGLGGPEGADLDRREARALAAADVVVATSRYAAQDLQRRYGLEGVLVARPGVERGALSAGSPVPQLLSLGAITPAKNHALLLAALEDVADLPWTLSVVGPARDLRHLRSLQNDAEQRGLGPRITWSPALGDEELEQVWARTDLLVHVSRSETFGMVVVEAHAHGVPTVVGAGTGAVEALLGRDAEPSTEGSGRGPGLPGVAVSTRDPRDLAEALRAWSDDAGLRSRWWDAAVRRRNHLWTWAEAATVLETAVTRGAGRGAGR